MHPGKKQKKKTKETTVHTYWMSLEKAQQLKKHLWVYYKTLSGMYRATQITVTTLSIHGVKDGVLYCSLTFLFGLMPQANK